LQSRSPGSEAIQLPLRANVEARCIGGR
jgi:hypothetical protein